MGTEFAMVEEEGEKGEDIWAQSHSSFSPFGPWHRVTRSVQLNSLEMGQPVKNRLRHE